MRLPAHATAPFVLPQALALQRRYPWERTGAGTTVVTQPRGSGAVRVSTRAQLCGETCR